MATQYAELNAPFKPQKELSGTLCKCGKKTYDVKYYYLWNIIAACLHGVNALLMLIFYYGNDKHDKFYNVTTSYGNWTRVDDQWVIESREATIISNLSLNWSIFTFHVLSFVFPVRRFLYFTRMTA